MPSMLDRLRRLHEARPQRTEPQPGLSPTPRVAGAHLEDLVPGQEIANESGSCYASVQSYPLERQRGGRPLGAVLEHTPASLAPLYPAAQLDGEFDFARAAFIDTETSGLGSGASVYAFMVGIATFEDLDHWQLETGPAPPSAPPRPPNALVVRQYFMRHPGEEGALLLAVAAALRRCRALVTFNGRTFDVPLLRSRYTLNRRSLPPGNSEVGLLVDPTPHLDLLHPARRLWRRRLQSCALGNLERHILQWQRKDDDVPGSLIPGLYLQFLQTGHAGQIHRVFYHNQEDIVSMVALAEQICRHFADPQPQPGQPDLQGLDLLSLAKTYLNLDRRDDAENALRLVLETVEDPSALAEAFLHLGNLMKRQGRWPAAVEVWQRWLTTVAGPDPTPYVELAKYFEWHARDWPQAAMWTAWALHNLRDAQSWPQAQSQIQALEHRLQRLQNKQHKAQA